MIPYNPVAAPSSDQENRFFRGFSTGWGQLAEVAEDKNKKQQLDNARRSLELDARRLALQDKQTNLQYQLGLQGQQLDSRKLDLAAADSQRNFQLQSGKLSLLEKTTNVEIENTQLEMRRQEEALAASKSLMSLVANSASNNKWVPTYSSNNSANTKLTNSSTLLNTPTLSNTSPLAKPSVLDNL